MDTEYSRPANHRSDECSAERATQAAPVTKRHREHRKPHGDAAMSDGVERGQGRPALLQGPDASSAKLGIATR